MKTIENYYNLISGKYDEATNLFSWKVPSLMQGILKDYKVIKKGIIVLDLGVGTGQILQIFAKKDCKVVGVDISSEMLKNAKKKYPFLKDVKYDIEKGLLKILKPESFNLIISGGVLEFIKDIEKVFKETYVLLKKDGYFLFTYEMLIQEHAYQKKEEQYVQEGYSKNIDRIAEFKIYRREKSEIAKLLKKNNFKKIRHFKIKAYLKTEQKIPVYYGVVLGRKLDF